jgi:Bacterial Ig-like domain (group 3)
VLVQAVCGASWKNRTTTATGASSANPSALGSAVTFTATIVGSSSSVPTDRVLFMVNGNVVGDPAGIAVTFVSGTTVRAVLAVPGLAHGSHKVTVTYLGDVNYKGSTATVTQTVN